MTLEQLQTELQSKSLYFLVEPQEVGFRVIKRKCIKRTGELSGVNEVLIVKQSYTTESLDVPNCADLIVEMFSGHDFDE